jgi:hypothetical protein
LDEEIDSPRYKYIKREVEEAADRAADRALPSDILSDNVSAERQRIREKIYGQPATVDLVSAVESPSEPGVYYVRYSLEIHWDLIFFSAKYSRYSSHYPSPLLLYSQC